MLSLFAKKIPSGYEEETDVAEYQYLIDEYLRYFWPSQAHSLQRLSQMARRVVPKITSRTLVLAGEKDDIVPLRAAKFVMEKISSQDKELALFKKSGHDLLNDVEKELVIERILFWLENHSSEEAEKWP